MQRSAKPWILIAMGIALALSFHYLDADTDQKLERLRRDIEEIDEKLVQLETRLPELQSRVRAHRGAHETPSGAQGSADGDCDGCPLK